MISDNWKKSSYSQGGDANCVEARSPQGEAAVNVRDTQNRELGHLSFTADAWAAFLADVRHGKL